MSAGGFLRAFYETDTGEIAAARIQPETAAFVLGGTTNVIPAGPATLPIDAKMNGAASRYVIRARYVTVRWTGTPPTGYLTNSTIRIPVLRPGTFSSYVAAGRGATGTYLGAEVQLEGWKAENS